MTSPAPSDPQRTSRSRCIFFRIGRCGNGDECKFSHNIQPATPQSLREQSDSPARRSRQSIIETPVEEHDNPPVASREVTPDDYPNDLTAADASPAPSDTSAYPSTDVIQQLDGTYDDSRSDDSEHSSHSENSIPPRNDSIWVISQDKDTAVVDAELEHSSTSEAREGECPPPEEESDTELDHSPIADSSENDTFTSDTLGESVRDAYQKALVHSPIAESSENGALVSGNSNNLASDTHQKDDLDHSSIAESSGSDNPVSATGEQPNHSTHQADEPGLFLVPESSEKYAVLSQVPENSEASHTPEYDSPPPEDEQMTLADIHDGSETGEMAIHTETVDSGTYVYNHEPDIFGYPIDPSPLDPSTSQSFNNGDDTQSNYPPDYYNWDPSLQPYPDIPSSGMTLPHWTEHADPYANFMVPFCRFLAQGRCLQGDACRFRHSLSVNEFSLLFHDAQPPLWKPEGTTAQADDANKALVSPFNVCKFYPMGNCRNGQSCPYLHIPSNDLLSIFPEEVSESYEKDDSQQIERKNQPCKYYLEPGGCRRGDGCHFSHGPVTLAYGIGEGSLKTDDGGRKETGEVPRPKQQRICRWFQQGGCQYGDGCKFLHDSPTEDVHLAERSRSAPSEETEPVVRTNDSLSWERQNIRWSDDEDDWTRQAIPSTSNMDNPHTPEEAVDHGWGENVDEWAVQQTTASTEQDARVPEEGTPSFGWSENVDEWAIQETVASIEKDMRMPEKGALNLRRGEYVDERAVQKTAAFVDARVPEETLNFGWGETVDEWALQEAAAFAKKDAPAPPEETPSFGWGENVDEWAAQETPVAAEETQSSRWVDNADERAAQSITVVARGEAQTSKEVSVFGWGEYVDEWATQASQTVAGGSVRVPEGTSVLGGGKGTNEWVTKEASHRAGKGKDRSGKEDRPKENGWSGQKDGLRTNERDICRFHAQGYCRKGAQCNLSHDLLLKSRSQGRGYPANTLPTTPSTRSESYPKLAIPPPINPEVQASTAESSRQQATSVPASGDNYLGDDNANISWAAPAKPICDFFARGHCKYGDRCMLRHEEAPILSTKHIAEPSTDTETDFKPPSVPSEEQDTEDALAEDEAPLGTDGCDIDDQPTTIDEDQSSYDNEKTWEIKWPDEPVVLPTPSKIEAPCKAFGQGYCELGDACPYQHISDPLESQERGSTPSAPDNDQMPEITGQIRVNQPELHQEEPELLVERELFNCTVRFGLDNGCSPTSIRSASDAFQAIVSNLPTDISFAEALELAVMVNATQRDEDVVLEGTDMVINFAEPLSAVKAVTKLHGQTYASRPLTARLTTETIVSPLERKAVKITWPSPSRSAWAYYPSAYVAKINEKRLSGMIFQGRKIKAELYRARKNDASYAVRISGLLVNVDRPALEELAQAMVVHLNAATYMEPPLDNIHATLARAAQGSIESFHRLPLEPTQSKHMAFARFYAGLPNVMTEHGKSCNFLGDGESLSLQEIFYANYRVSARRYQAVKISIEQLRETHKEHCQMRIYDDEEPVDIHIYVNGENCAAFGEVNRDVRETLQGELVTQAGNSAPLWDEYFDLSSSARAIERINNDKSFFVKVDHRRQAVYILGDEASREQGKSTLQKLLGMVRAQRHVLPLDLSMLRHLIDGGFESLQEELGANKLTLDVAIPHLVVRGDADMKKVKTTLSAPTALGKSQNDITDRPSSLCPVCRRPPREPVKLSCKHTYCTACLRHALNSRTQITPLRCLLGCEEYIPYVIVRDVLPMASEAALLRNAFLFYVRTRPEEFFFCPLPHCETVFRLLSADRRGALSIVYMCPGCSTKVCASCGLEYHEGWDCNVQPESTSFLAITTDN